MTCFYEGKKLHKIDMHIMFVSIKKIIAQSRYDVRLMHLHFGHFELHFNIGFVSKGFML